ncbi:hypothetical protein [Pararhodospirillum oryzae]|uniref:Uncharacterized protein n=1 Tax=Pararhodospirillum oryzae TaxID=478448 RepID=A0A512H617_9PROT|nr:hypothetical protein [Pararhodospirillum oryzae]GEO80916.1 hypothetical protein ROR02_10470 [Pararhodospirillum oryzae]
MTPLHARPLPPTPALRVSPGLAPARPARLLVEAARTWARTPDGRGGFEPALARQVCAAGLGSLLPALDGLMVIIAVHAPAPLALGAPGSEPTTSDARLLVAALNGLVTTGESGGPAIDRLALRLGARGGALARACLARLAQALPAPAVRMVWPSADATQAAVFPEATEEKALGSSGERRSCRAFFPSLEAH